MARASISFLFISFIALSSAVIRVNARCTFSCHIPANERAREELQFVLWTEWSDPVSEKAGIEIERMMRDIGIKTIPTPTTDFLIAENLNKRHTFEIYIRSEGFSTYPRHLYDRLHSNELRFLGTNYVGYNNTEFDAKWEAAAEEDDARKRIFYLWEAQDVPAQDLPYIPLFTTEVVYTIRDGWIGFNPIQGGIFNDLNRRTAINLSHVNGTGADFILAVPSFDENYSPILSHDDLSRYLTSLIYDSLVSVGDGLEITPWLVEEWVSSDDGLMVTLEITQGATWHDGKPLTAKDVKFTLDLLERSTHLTRPPLFNSLGGVEVQGDYSVTLVLEKPYSWTLNDLAEIPVLPQHLWSQRDTNWTMPLGEGVVGSGPFTWNSSERREWIRLEANSEYWMEGKPRLGSLTLSVYELSKDRFQAVLSGEADADFRELDLSLKEEAEADGSLVPLEETRCLSSRDYAMFFNQIFDPVLKDSVVKKAIAYALDKQDLAEAVNPGFASPSETYIPVEYFGGEYNDPIATKYDRNIYLANQMLDRAGYLDIDADGIREIPEEDRDTGEETPETVTITKLEGLEREMDSLSLRLDETWSLLTSMDERSRNTLTIVYWTVPISVIIAAVAAYFVLREQG